MTNTPAVGGMAVFSRDLIERAASVLASQSFEAWDAIAQDLKKVLSRPVGKPENLDWEPEIVGRQCFPSEAMRGVATHRDSPWIDDAVGKPPSSPGYYRVEPLMRQSDHYAFVTQLLEQLQQADNNLGVTADKLFTAEADVQELQTEVDQLKSRIAILEAKQQEEAVAYRVLVDGVPGDWVLGLPTEEDIRDIPGGALSDIEYALPQAKANSLQVSATVCGFTSGQSIVEFQLPKGPLPSWLELGKPVTLSAGSPGPTFAPDYAHMGFRLKVLIGHCQEQDQIIADQRDSLNLIRLYEEGTVWHWQVEGDNHLETIGCPVVINGDDLRELISHYDMTRAADLLRQVENALCIHDDIEDTKQLRLEIVDLLEEIEL